MTPPAFPARTHALGARPGTRDGAPQKVLIVKPGYSETLDPETTGVVSLGDVLRTTVVLHLFPAPHYEVTWLVDQAGAPLLKGNPLVHRILVVNAFTPFHLMAEWFDIVVNLEKDPGICALVDKIPAWRRYGFRFDPRSGTAVAHDHAEEAHSVASDQDVKRRQTKSWSALLYGILGVPYDGQPYVLGYRPRTTEDVDVGLNHKVGVKFPLKAWPIERWSALAERLAPHCSVAWQEGEHDLEGYVDWINRCRVLVTNDSLGLHLGLALGKPIVALIGPTSASEIPDAPNLVKLGPEVDWDCVPCLETRCPRPVPCMEHIAVDRVAGAVRELLLRRVRPVRPRKDSSVHVELPA
jgi:heptosyltransferase-2